MFDFSLSKLTEDIEWRNSYFQSQLESLNEKLDEIFSKDETLSLHFAEMNIPDDLDKKIKDYEMFFRVKKKEMKEKSVTKKNRNFGCKYLNNAFTFE